MPPTFDLQGSLDFQISADCGRVAAVHLSETGARRAAETRTAGSARTCSDFPSRKPARYTTVWESYANPDDVFSTATARKNLTAAVQPVERLAHALRDLEGRRRRRPLSGFQQAVTFGWLTSRYHDVTFYEERIDNGRARLHHREPLDLDSKAEGLRRARPQPAGRDGRHRLQRERGKLRQPRLDRDQGCLDPAARPRPVLALSDLAREPGLPRRPNRERRGHRSGRTAHRAKLPKAGAVRLGNVRSMSTTTPDADAVPVIADDGAAGRQPDADAGLDLLQPELHRSGVQGERASRRPCANGPDAATAGLSSLRRADADAARHTRRPVRDAEHHDVRGRWRACTPTTQSSGTTE